MPSSKPYSKVSTGGHDNDDTNYTDNVNNDNNNGGVIATQSLDSLDSQSMDIQLENEAQTNNEKYIRCKLLLSVFLLAALAFGGHEYYIKSYGDGDSSSIGHSNHKPLFGGNDKKGKAGTQQSSSNIRGSSNDYDWGNSPQDLDITDETFEELNIEDYDDEDGVLHMVESEENPGEGIEEYEGDLDDDIANGEAVGEFDTDMHFDDTVSVEEGYNDMEEDVVVFSSSDTDAAVIINEEEDASIEQSIEEGDDMDGEGEDAVSEAPLTFEEDVEDGTGSEVKQNSRPEEIEDNGEGKYDDYNWDDLPTEVKNAAEVLGWSSNMWDDDEEDPESYEVYWNQLAPDQQQAAVVLGYTEPSWNEEEDENDDDDFTETEEEIEVVEKEELDSLQSTADEDLPDYFVPLTPGQREVMKKKLRSTLAQTKEALIYSGHIPKDVSNPKQPQRTLVLDSGTPKQFMHMHHMKTGGTSMDGLISCALRRQREIHRGTSIAYSKMSECGSRVKTCMNDLAKHLNSSVVDNVFYRNDADGQARVEDQFSFDPADKSQDIPIDDLNVCTTSESNVMSYCASLHAVRTFGWKDVDKITVIRNPIDRAWSMYKYSLNRCYKCKELKDVLRSVADGTFGDGKQNFVYSPNDSCAVQMIGHQATNLLSSINLYNVANDVTFPREQEIVDEAVNNLRSFTWIGITDRIQESVDAMRTVFPFLAENLSTTAAELQGSYEKSYPGDDMFSLLPEGYIDSKGCKFEHRNGSREPTCGTTELDEETISLIKKLNNRDVAVYKAAVERFELQQEVLAEFNNGLL